MIKALAVTIVLTVMASSISEFSLSPEESFTLHFEHDYVFTLEECSTSCSSLRISQLIGGTTTWTGQLFDLQEKRSYPLQMDFEDVIFDSVYVVALGETTTLRVSYREPAPLQSQQRLVRTTSEKETTHKASAVIICEMSAVIFLIFLVAHRMLHKNQVKKEGSAQVIDIPHAAVGFHDVTQGIPRHFIEEDDDLELLQRVKELEGLKEMEIRQGMRRRLKDEETMGLDWI
jgi:hypothetical protein